MEQKDTSQFFQNLGEIWRDITAIEFLMRSAITKNDREESKFPQPPYEKGKSYKKYPKAFAHLSFEIVTAKFNKRFPKLAIPEELVQLRNAMAHGITAEIDKSGTIQLVKFKETNDPKELKVEFSLTLEFERIAQIRQSLIELKRHIMNEINENTSANTA
jgi:hypothetical protein